MLDPTQLGIDISWEGILSLKSSLFLRSGQYFWLNSLRIGLDCNKTYLCFEQEIQLVLRLLWSRTPTVSALWAKSAEHLEDLVFRPPAAERVFGPRSRMFDGSLPPGETQSQKEVDGTSQSQPFLSKDVNCHIGFQPVVSACWVSSCLTPRVFGNGPED